MHFNILTTAAILSSLSTIAVAAPRPQADLPIFTKYFWEVSKWQASCTKTDAPLKDCSYSFQLTGLEAKGGATIIPAFTTSCEGRTNPGSGVESPCKLIDAGPAGRTLKSTLINPLLANRTASVQLQVTYQFVDQGDMKTSFKYTGDVLARFKTPNFEILTGEVIKVAG